MPFTVTPADGRPAVPDVFPGNASAVFCDERSRTDPLVPVVVAPIAKCNPDISPKIALPMFSQLLVFADGVSTPLPIRMFDEPVLRVALADSAPIVILADPVVRLSPAP